MRNQPAPGHLPDPEHVRGRMPQRFSWIDQRALDRLGGIQSSHACGLYLVLVMLGDRHGLSYYSDKSLGRRLRIDPVELRRVRRQLVDAGLVAYRAPFYQVRDLQEGESCSPKKAAGREPEPRRVGDEEDDPESEEQDTEEIRRQLRALRESLRQGSKLP